MTHTSSGDEPQGFQKSTGKHDPFDLTDDLLKQLSEYEPLDLSSLLADENLAALTKSVDEIDLSSFWSEDQMATLAKLVDESDKLNASSFWSDDQMTELLKQFDTMDLEKFSEEWSTSELTELLNQVKFTELEGLTSIGMQAEPPAAIYPNATALEVATWMKSEIDARTILYQDWVATNIRQLFGKQYVYPNKNRNLAISRDVLTEYLRLTKDYVVWNKRKRFWRIRRSDDPNTRSVTL
jgi:hypothetical protein